MAGSDNFLISWVPTGTTRGSGVLPKRPADIWTRASRVLPIAALVLLVGCARGGANGSTSSSSPSRPAPTPTVTAAASSPEQSEDPQAAVVAAYERYLDAATTATASADPNHPELLDTARGQALAAVQARVATLSSQDRTARGRFLPAIEAVEIDGETAEIRDCYRADITEHSADTGEEVADRAGARFAAWVELEQLSDGRWVVVAFHEGDPCVPSELAAVIEDRYREFWDALATAGSPPDPDHPALADVAAGEQLDGLREQLRRFRDAGHEVRNESVSHPTTLEVSDHDTVARLRDCRELDPEGGVYESSSGELVDGGARPGQRALWEARLELIGGSWKVVDADLVEEDSACAA